MQDTPVKMKAKPILQGATYSLALIRRYLPLIQATITPCGEITNSCTGAPVVEGDYTDEDYTGCTARMQIRPAVGSPDIIFDGDTTDGSIVLSGATLTIEIDAATTALMDFKKAIGHIEVTRADATVQRQYELTFTLSKEVTV